MWHAATKGNGVITTASLKSMMGSPEGAMLISRRLSVICAHLNPWRSLRLISSLPTASHSQLLSIKAHNQKSSDGGRRSYVTNASLELPHAESLVGKTALVTGSTQGIGLEVARVLYEAGAHVALNGFGNPDDIRKTVEQLQQLRVGKMHANRIAYCPADLSKPQEIEQLIKEAQRQLNAPIDILVNNAGIQHVSPLGEFPTEKWDQLIAVNLSAVFHAMRIVMPSMKERGYGRVINISSVHGLVASKNKAAYVAAKHGVVGLTKVAALEYAGSGVTCNCINPGWVLTDLVKKQIEAIADKSSLSFDDAAHHILQEKQPSLQFVTARQLGLTALFLCSDATSQLTGISIPVDGGWTSQ